MIDVRTRCLAVVLLGCAGTAASNGAAPPSAALAYQRAEGNNLNSFLRDGPVAAHVLLRSGSDPRVIVAFPAGNSGVGLWFDSVAAPAEWTMIAPPRAATEHDAKGRPLYGVRFEARVRAPRLAVKQAVLSSVRVLRDYQALGTAPAPVLTTPVIRGDTESWTRDRLDGAAGYRLAVQVVGGTLTKGGIAAKDGAITLRITALSGEAPLTPIAGRQLLNAKAAADPAARQALEFLSYREKFLAGSWRFDTYFGRDTLMSVRLLMPALQPEAVETGLRSVLERLSPKGEVAHEEDIGEFAVLDHIKADGSKAAAPTYNYNMIDSNFMLAPVARAWLLDDPRGKARAAAFLAGGAPSGKERLGDAMLRNLRFVAAQAAAFAKTPTPTHLISLKPGMDAGQWRDSNDGLGGGRYPYDVNAVFVPAALDAANALYASGLLEPYLTPADRRLLARLPKQAAVWTARAPAMFNVTVSSAKARAAILAYAGTLGIAPEPALRTVGNAPVRFHAIALDAGGKPVPIVNSDEGFAMLFGHPSAAALDDAAKVIGRPFPAGLRTGIGMLVADPVFVPPAEQARFGRNAYHGTVVWSWQQAMVAAGLARQLARDDLPADVRGRLVHTQACLWQGIEAARSVRNSELWSWEYKGGRYRIVPFGVGQGDADESNAAQLWSTVFLALPKPANATAGCSSN